MEQQLQQARGYHMRHLSLGMRLYSTIEEHQDKV